MFDEGMEEFEVGGSELITSTKTEYDVDGKERVHIFLNKGPFAEEYKENSEKRPYR